MNLIKIFLELSKIRISFFAAFLVTSGFMLSTGKVSIKMFFLSSGVFLLACGSSCLNQFQEKNIDILMDRTKIRPIPSKRIKPVNALFISIFLIFSGLLVIFYNTDLISFSLCVFTSFCYNVIYTYLKRITPFAVIPGSLIGAILPVIGWVAGSGYILNPKILVISFFFFIWQIAHFFLFFLNYGKDFEKSGLPSLTNIFTIFQLKRITFIWILSTSVSCFLIPFFGIAVGSYLANLFLFICTLWLIEVAIKFLKTSEEKFYFKLAFKKINIYAFLIMFLLFLSNLI